MVLRLWCPRLGSFVKLDESKGEQWSWLNQQFKKSIGNGLSTKFWKQKWIDKGKLKDMFARLFSISTDKDTLWSG